MFSAPVFFFLIHANLVQTFPFNAEHLRATTAWSTIFSDPIVALGVAKHKTILSSLHYKDSLTSM
jgi:hypothetical protein